MQNIDYVSRAKALLKAHARTAALVIVPLAAAVSAHAGAVLPNGNFQCSYSPNDNSGGNCAGGVNAAGGALSFYLSSGGVALQGGGTLMEHSNGSVATAITEGSSIPYSYEIGLFLEETDPSYALEIQIKDTTTSTMLVDSTFTGTFGLGSTPVTGSGTFTALGSSNSGDNIVVGYLLTLAGVPGNGLVTVTVPEGTSVDLGPVGNAGVPEPASVGLMGGGLAALGYLWRKRRKA
jgi:hypothetical protein